MSVDDSTQIQIRLRSLSKFSCTRRLFCPSTGILPGVFGDTNFSDAHALIRSRSLATMGKRVFPRLSSTQCDTGLLLLAMDFQGVPPGEDLISAHLRHLGWSLNASSDPSLALLRHSSLETNAEIPIPIPSPQVHPNVAHFQILLHNLL